MSLTPVRFDTCRAAPPLAGITNTLPRERNASVELSGDQRAPGGGPGSFVSRRSPVPSLLIRQRCVTRRFDGQSGVDSQNAIARPSGDNCGSPTRGMLSRSTGVIGRLAVCVATLDTNARHADARSVMKAARRAGIEVKRV